MHPCIREKSLSLDNNYIFGELQFSIINYSLCKESFLILHYNSWTHAKDNTNIHVTHRGSQVAHRGSKPDGPQRKPDGPQRKPDDPQRKPNGTQRKPDGPQRKLTRWSTEDRPNRLRLQCTHAWERRALVWIIITFLGNCNFQ